MSKRCPSAILNAKISLPVIAEDDDTDVVRLQVESHALDSAAELNHLSGLHLHESEDTGNTITDRNNSAELFQIVLKADSR